MLQLGRYPMLIEQGGRKLHEDSLDLVDSDPGKLSRRRYYLRAPKECRASHERRDEVSRSHIASNIERELINRRAAIKFSDPDLIQVRAQVAIHNLPSTKSWLASGQIPEVDCLRASPSTAVRFDMFQPDKRRFTCFSISRVDNLIVAPEKIAEPSRLPSLLLGLLEDLAEVGGRQGLRGGETLFGSPSDCPDGFETSRQL